AVSIIIQRLDKSMKVKFLTPETIVNPNLLWETIANHFQSNKASNQAHTFMNFLCIVFVNLPQNITDMRQGLLNMKDCGCSDSTEDSFLAETIVSKFPDNLETACEILAEK
ncbi:hypothetical protein CROQUDRAFT_40565, partial [Cronartium quercuum f. sp. fusiforme G11]